MHVVPQEVKYWQLPAQMPLPKSQYEHINAGQMFLEYLPFVAVVSVLRAVADVVAASSVGVDAAGGAAAVLAGWDVVLALLEWHGQG